METRFEPVLWLFALLLVTGFAAGQQPVPMRPAAARPVVVIDPAHGGADPGADLGDKVAEKAVTLSLAIKLRAALSASGFTVMLTRDSDGTASITADQRAEIANRSHALACVSLHATRSGAGVQVYTSALSAPPATADPSYVPQRWEIAQQDFVSQSTRMAAEVKEALAHAGLPADVRTATVPPLDSLMCPALAVEFAPVNNVAGGEKGAADGTYQDTAVQALLAALGKWRAESTPQPATAPGDPGAP